VELTDEQKSKLVRFIEARWRGTRECAVCGTSKWDLNDRIFELREFHGGNLVVGGQLIPVVNVTCSNCGNTIFINAIKAGVVESQPKGTGNG
jgi:hypothetical protein